MSQQVSRLEPLFAPRGIAVVGASRDPGKLGAVMLRSSPGAPCWTGSAAARWRTGPRWDGR